MNREIKFRGWFQGINGIEKWVYGYLVKQKNGNWEITNGETYWTVDDVGQYTGLKDKNGVEIYEGDVVFHESHNTKTVMKWIDKYICFAGETIDEVVKEEYNFYQSIDESKLVIIGNIH